MKSDTVTVTLYACHTAEGLARLCRLRLAKMPRGLVLRLSTDTSGRWTVREDHSRGLGCRDDGGAG